MSATTLFGAAVQVVVVAAVGWIAGGLLLDALERWSGRNLTAADEVDWPERALLGIVGFAIVSVVLMVAHIVSGGAVFGIGVIVPVALGAFLLWGWRDDRLPHGLPWAAIALAAILLGAVYARPAIDGGSGLRTGDIPWHMGWTEQLLDGDPVPTGPPPRFGANAYPWGFHAVLATMVRAVPGTSVEVAVEGLGFLLILAVPLAAACLGRRVRADAGWWAAGAASCIGGWGWIGARDVAFVTSPSKARFGADLVSASPNSIYELFPPALPRELGLVLLAGAGLVALLAARARGRRAGIVPGLATGLVGLVSVPMCLSAALWSLVVGGLRARPERTRFLVTSGATAALVFALWAAPVVAGLVRFGGFVDITPELGKEWPVPDALWAWGLLGPLALLGAVLVVRRQGKPATTIACWVLVTTLLLVLARIRAVLEWGLGGNATVLHQGRVWPVAHLLGAVLGGVALAWIATRVGKRRPLVGLLAGVTVLLAGLVSPSIASRSLAETIGRHEGGFSFSRDDLAPGSFVRRVAGRLDSSDVVEVDGPPGLALSVWQFSGARLAKFDDPRLSSNDLRIRFRELAAAWDRRAAAGGFNPNYAVVPIAQAPADARVLDRGRYGGGTWVFVQA